MNINEKLIKAVSTVIPICVPNFSPGSEDEYAEFEVDAEPDWYFDGVPHALRYDITLRWYMPVDVNPAAKKDALRDALSSAEFLLQQVEDLSDNLTQGYEYTLRYWDPV